MASHHQENLLPTAPSELQAEQLPESVIQQLEALRIKISSIVLPEHSLTEIDTALTQMGETAKQITDPETRLSIQALLASLRLTFDDRLQDEQTILESEQDLSTAILLGVVVMNTVALPYEFDMIKPVLFTLIDRSRSFSDVQGWLTAGVFIQCLLTLIFIQNFIQANKLVNEKIATRRQLLEGKKKQN